MCGPLSRAAAHRLHSYELTLRVGTVGGRLRETPSPRGGSRNANNAEQAPDVPFYPTRPTAASMPRHERTVHRRRRRRRDALPQLFAVFHAEHHRRQALHRKRVAVRQVRRTVPHLGRDWRGRAPPARSRPAPSAPPAAVGRWRPSARRPAPPGCHDRGAVCVGRRDDVPRACGAIATAATRPPSPAGSRCTG